MTVFEVVIVVALLLAVVAIVGLFAMMGELSARVGARPEENDRTVEPVDGAVTGVVPRTWPDGLGHLADAELAAVLVFSPRCGSCARIAPTVAGHPARDRTDVQLGVLVSCHDSERGLAFVREHNLSGVPYAFDVEGAWTAGEFAVTTSPTLLLFQDGHLRSASSIGSLASVDIVVRQLQSKEETNVSTNNEAAAHHG